MGSFKKNQYSADNGKYERFLNKDGKAEGIKKVAIDIGRNDLCPCKSLKKYKDCCLKTGGFFVPTKHKGARMSILKIRLKRIFKLK